MERIQDYWNVQSTEAKALAKEVAEREEDLVTMEEAQEILEGRAKDKRQDITVKQKTLQEYETTLSELTEKVSETEERHRATESELDEKEDLVNVDGFL